METPKPKDYSRMGNEPATITAPNGMELKLYPVSIPALCADMGRHIKSRRQDNILQLARKDRTVTPEVLAKTLAEIEEQSFTMDKMVEEMNTMDGMRYVIYKSLLPGRKAMKLEGVDDILPPDEWAATLNLILGMSGVKTGGGDGGADPTKDPAPTP